MDYTMNNVVFLPSSPALIAELAPNDEPSRRLLNEAVKLLTPLVQEHPASIDVVCSHDQRWYTAHQGSSRAWGAPQVGVGQGHYLGELIARYILQAAGAEAGHVSESRDYIGQLNSSTLTIVMLDGSGGLTERAPLALLDTAAEVHSWCQEALQGQASPMEEHRLIDGGVIEPSLWLEVQKLRPRQAQLVDSDSTLGVGRFIATWKA